jgi:molecular chaperone DnaJ
LADSEKRSIYDRFGHDGLRGEGFSGFSGFNSSVFSDFEDILGSFFNFGFGDIFGAGQRGGKRYSRQGRDLALEIELDLEQAAKGMDKKLNLDKYEICAECGGTRLAPGTKTDTCPTCEGRGQMRYQQGFFSIARTCSHCAGEGEIINTPCPSCRGKGKVRKKKSISINIPAGVDDGMRLRVEGEGEAGERGGPSGDLYVIIRLKKHPFYERENSNLLCGVDLSFSQASLGASLAIPTLDSSEILKIPAGTQTGTVFRIKGRGIEGIHSHRKGDLFVKVNVKTPTHLSKKQKELLNEFASSRGEEIKSVDKSHLKKE